MYQNINLTKKKNTNLYQTIRYTREPLVNTLYWNNTHIHLAQCTYLRTRSDHVISHESAQCSERELCMPPRDEIITADKLEYAVLTSQEFFNFAFLGRILLFSNILRFNPFPD